MCKMIHNKYFYILEQFLGDYNKEVHGRGLINKVNLSQKAIALTLEELENQGILKSQKKGNMKHFRLNLLNTEIKAMLQITELTKKINFFLKHRKLANIFNEDNRIVGVFGSYAKGTQKEDSDIDIFIIGKKRKGEYENKGNLLGLKISIKYLSEKEFGLLLRKKNALLKEMLENHVLIFGAEKFINVIWRNYYGFN